MSRPDLRSILEPLILGGFAWEEMDSKLDDNQRRQYAENAKLIMESAVWKNETQRLSDLWYKSAILKAGSYEEIESCRAHISALALLQERFEQIAAWAKPVEKPAEFPHDPI